MLTVKKDRVTREEVTIPVSLSFSTVMPRRAWPFTAPEVIPSTIYFCAVIYSLQSHQAETNKYDHFALLTDKFYRQNPILKRVHSRIPPPHHLIMIQ